MCTKQRLIPRGRERWLTVESIPENEALPVIGDFSGHEGPRRIPRKHCLGPHNDTRKERICKREQQLALCAQFRLWITNPFYQHRHIPIQTRYKGSDLNGLSLNNFIPTHTNHRRHRLDSRCHAGHRPSPGNGNVQAAQPTIP